MLQKVYADNVILVVGDKTVRAILTIEREGRDEKKSIYAIYTKGILKGKILWVVKESKNQRIKKSENLRLLSPLFLQKKCSSA